ncbi:MAG: inorganic phosphate transporter [Acetobacteraceae bacterium]
MSDATIDAGASATPAGHHHHGHHYHRPQLDQRAPLPSVIVFIGLLVAGVLFALYGLMSDIGQAGTPPLAIGVFLLLGVALLIALGFEFVNGFHDTANAVATVIYTHSLPAQAAVVWSGCWNLIGVVTSSGAVAFGIISLLPVELILQVGSNAGFAMIFALLIAAIIWNLGTWVLGIPASSSHTLIGSIIGVGVANQLMAPAGSATSGVDWTQAMGVFRALLFSPLVGFVASAMLLLVMKMVVRQRKLYEAPDTSHPPPAWIRGLLILTCTGVSFAHGSNDGQKGMGLIMLILIGAVPTAYALNHALPTDATPAFLQAMEQGRVVFDGRAGTLTMPSRESRRAVEDAVRTREVNTPTVYAGLSRLTQDIATAVKENGAIARVPAAAVQNVRNDMYLVSEAVRLIQKQDLAGAAAATLTAVKAALDSGTKFIPFWVKVSVAIALGLGTMVGWKRIVITVGEKIGKSHLTYGQGASAEMVAAATIMAADMYGLPVSTTHVLSSGIAGTMAANGSGLQWSTVRSIALAWVLTLPAAILLSATLYYVFRSMV